MQKNTARQRRSHPQPAITAISNSSKTPRKLLHREPTKGASTSSIQHTESQPSNHSRCQLPPQNVEEISTEGTHEGYEYIKHPAHSIAAAASSHMLQTPSPNRLGKPQTLRRHPASSTDKNPSNGSDGQSHAPFSHNQRCRRPP